MNAHARMKRVLSLVLALVLVFSLMPVSARAAETGREASTIFFATDRHEETSKLKSLLQALAYAPGLVVLGGDHVNNTNSGSLASITAEIQSVYPGVQTFYTYAAHDPNVSPDNSNPYAYARTGEVYEGADYYVYGVDQDDMQSSSSASSASAAFKSWAQGADSSKVIFVMCHMPIHSRRGDNAGGATWMSALNEVGQSHDVVFLWGHNHTGESSADTAVYFVGVGGSLTPQGGSTGTINFTYMNAGYIKNGYASMVVVNSDHVDVTRYSTSGSVAASYSFERRFAVSHTWEVSDYVATTCTEDGYQTAFCTSCGETKTTVIPATGHAYSEHIQDTCTGSFTVYSCGNCGYSYSEQNATETTYEKASALENGESYVIVASNYALTYGSSAGKTSVSVSNDAITSNVSDAMIWTYENGMLSNSSSGTTYYINLSGYSSRRTVTFTNSGASVSYSSSKLKIGSYYLYYSSSSGFSARSSGSNVTLYKVNEAFGGTGAHAYEAVTVNATCTQNGSVTYTCTLCGDSYSEVIEATGVHAYECETVDATCTQNGSVTYTCTSCGDSYSEVIEATGHAYEAVVTEATCTEGGYTTYTCACGDSYVAEETEALGHAYEARMTEPTCTEDGYITYTCVCGDSYTEIMEAPGHSYEASVSEPTCTENGCTTHTCVICGDSYITDETDAYGHDYETVVVEATCTENGCTMDICRICGDSLTYDETEALGHSYESVVVAPTCTEGGYTTYTCACGDSYVADETEALGHDVSSVVTDPTCTEGGYTTHTCLVCGDVTVDSVTEALGHDYESVTVEATCTEDGSVTSSCTVCGEGTVEVIPAPGHAYETVTVDATCTEDGSVTTTCTVCADTHVEVIEATGHAYEAVVTAPTCTEGGYTTYTCACGDSYVAEETEALGHAYEAVVTAPTCTEGGYTTYTCACGDSYVAEETEALGHAYEAVVTAPTCTEGGYTTYTCACGDSYVAEETEALGHAYETVVTAPTCTEGGYTTYTCACGDSYVAEETEALGHSYTVEEVGNELVYTCACGHSYSESLEISYSYDKVSAFASGEQFVITLYSGGKYYALSHEDNDLRAVQVTVSGDRITSEITEDMLWTYDDGKLSYQNGSATYYLYSAAASGWLGWFGGTTLDVSTSQSSAVSFSSNKVKVGSYYLRYSSGSIKANRSATTAYLFQQNEE